MAQINTSSLFQPHSKCARMMSLLVGGAPFHDSQVHRSAVHHGTILDFHHHSQIQNQNIVIYKITIWTSKSWTPPLAFLWFITQTRFCLTQRNYCIQKKHAIHHCIKALKISYLCAHDQTIGTKQSPTHITYKTACVRVSFWASKMDEMSQMGSEFISLITMWSLKIAKSSHTHNVSSVYHSSLNNNCESEPWGCLLEIVFSIIVVNGLITICTIPYQNVKSGHLRTEWDRRLNNLGIVQPKMKILSSFTQLHAIPNLYQLYSNL